MLRKRLIVLKGEYCHYRRCVSKFFLSVSDFFRKVNSIFSTWQYFYVLEPCDSINVTKKIEWTVLLQNLSYIGNLIDARSTAIKKQCRIRSRNSPNGFLVGILGFHVIGAASMRIEQVWADLTVSRTATRRFLAFWISDVTESRPETTNSPATESTSCLTRANTLSWCWRGSILSTWFVSCSANLLSVQSAAIGSAQERSFFP